MANGWNLDGGIHRIPLPGDVAGLWLCGKHVAAPDPDSLLERTGAGTIVCLTKEHEIAGRYPEYPRWLRANAGGRAVWSPIGDLGMPSLGAFRPVLDSLVERLRAGNGLIVHCAAGIGRAGTTAVALSMLLGRTVDDALEVVGRHRPLAGPEAGSQRQLIADLADELGSGWSDG